jgi:hypothetical protein
MSFFIVSLGRYEVRIRIIFHLDEVFIFESFKSCHSWQRSLGVTEHGAVTFRRIFVPPHITAVWHKEYALQANKINDNKSEYCNLLKECAGKQKRDLKFPSRYCHSVYRLYWQSDKSMFLRTVTVR